MYSAPPPCPLHAHACGGTHTLPSPFLVSTPSKAHCDTDTTLSSTEKEDDLLTLRELGQEDAEAVTQATTEDASARLQPLSQKKSYTQHVLSWSVDALADGPDVYSVLGVFDSQKVIGYIGRFHVVGMHPIGGASEWPRSQSRPLADLLSEHCGISLVGPLNEPTSVVSWTFMKHVTQADRLTSIRIFLGRAQAAGVTRVVVLLSDALQTLHDQKTAEALGMRRNPVRIPVPKLFMSLGWADVWELMLI